MLQKIIISFLFLFGTAALLAQATEYPTLRNYDYIYRKYIKSVRFYQFDSETDYPILELNSPNHFILEFDDMEAFTKDYFYKVVHCDAQWNPSTEIEAIDYIEGYEENRIFDVRNSFSTKVPYVHYEVELPNEDIKWTKSGNYLLKVYQNDDEKDLIITRRFMIVDTKMKAVPKAKRSAIPPYSASHQEMEFEVQHAGIKIGNPRDQLHVAVLQNGRWDNAVTGIQPTYIRNEAIGYDMSGKILFPGYKEFRPLDLRTFRFRTQQVKTLNESADRFDILLFPNTNRAFSPHIFTHDINGKFIIQSHDYPEEKLQSEYGHIHFKLKASAPYAKDVYVVGGFTDFRPMPAYKMKYNAKDSRYELSCLLKNGFYDYYYGVAAKGSEKVNIKKIEGSSFETENDYLFLVYFKTFGGLYDQLVAVQKLNTNPR